MMKDLGFSYGDGEYDLYPLYPQCKRKARMYCADMNTDIPLEYITLSAGRNTNYALDKRGTYPSKHGKTAYDKVCISVEKPAYISFKTFSKLAVYFLSIFIPACSVSCKSGSHLS